jgi:hypothetical protein
VACFELVEARRLWPSSTYVRFLLSSWKPFIKVNMKVSSQLGMLGLFRAACNKKSAYATTSRSIYAHGSVSRAHSSAYGVERIRKVVERS